MILRNWRSASSMPAAVQRRHMSPDLPALDVAAGAADGLDHRLARVRRRERALEPAADAEAGEGERLLQALAQRGGGAGVRALELGGERAQLLERAAWSSSAQAARSRRLTSGRSRSGRWSSTLRSLWRTQRCTGVWRRTRRGPPCASALAPSRTTSTPCSTSRPRSTRSASSVVATVAFSVEPSHSPSGILDAVGRDPERDDAAAALQLDPVEHQHRQAHVVQRAAHQRVQVLARARRRTRG